jgi:hypothetical protein
MPQVKGKAASKTAAILLLCLCALPLFAEPRVDISRDGDLYKLVASVEVERSASRVWNCVWQFKNIKYYLDNVKKIDSLTGGEDWYTVRYTAEFPFLHTEVTFRKWIVEYGRLINTESIDCFVKSPFPIGMKSCEAFWRIDSLGPNRSRLYFEQITEVRADGLEALYMGIARNDGRRILANFKKLAESR